MLSVTQNLAVTLVMLVFSRRNSPVLGVGMAGPDPLHRALRGRAALGSK